MCDGNLLDKDICCIKGQCFGRSGARQCGQLDSFGHRCDFREAPPTGTESAQAEEQQGFVFVLDLTSFQRLHLRVEDISARKKARVIQAT